MGPYTDLVNSEDRMGTLVAILISCVNACILNLAVLFAIKDLGAVGTQLVAQAKAILTILGGMAIFGEQVTPWEGVGAVLVLAGVYFFNRMETYIIQQRELKAASAGLKKMEEKE